MYVVKNTLYIFLSHNASCNTLRMQAPIVGLSDGDAVDVELSEIWSRTPKRVRTPPAGATDSMMASYTPASSFGYLTERLISVTGSA